MSGILGMNEWEKFWKPNRDHVEQYVERDEKTCCASCDEILNGDEEIFCEKCSEGFNQVKI